MTSNTEINERVRIKLTELTALEISVAKSITEFDLLSADIVNALRGIEIYRLDPPTWDECLKIMAEFGRKNWPEEFSLGLDERRRRRRQQYTQNHYGSGDGI